MGRKDPPAKKSKHGKSDAELAELTPDEIAPPAEIHGPAGPQEHVPRGERAGAPAAPLGEERIAGVEIPGAGLLNPPGYEPPPPPAPEPVPIHIHGPDCTHDHEPPPPAPIVREEPKVGRNDPCPCGSGRKWKKCCGK